MRRERFVSLSYLMQSKDRYVCGFECARRSQSAVDERIQVLSNSMRLAARIEARHENRVLRPEGATRIYSTLYTKFQEIFWPVIGLTTYINS
jgi:hypothetical protein